MSYATACRLSVIRVLLALVALVLLLDPLQGGCKIRRFDGLTVSPGKSQKQGQEDQGT